MPKPELDCIVINAKSGYARTNCSWVLSRMLRDFDYWRPRDVDDREEAEVDELIARNRESKRRGEKVEKEKNLRVALRVSVWQYRDIPPTVLKDEAGKYVVKGSGDWVYWIGIAVAMVQLSIAAVPWGVYGEWLTFLATAAGTALAFASGALPQWTQEKIQVRSAVEAKDVFLTEGNGAHDAILILGTNGGLDFEALAAPYRELVHPWKTRIMSLVFAALWIVLLISIAGYTGRTWYLLGIGIIGILHNAVVAGMKRQPKAFGIDLAYKETFVKRKVIEVLWNLESQYPMAGRALLETFFPGGLFPREKRLWDYADRRAIAWNKWREARQHAIDTARKRKGREYERDKEASEYNRFDKAGLKEFGWDMPPIRRPDGSEDDLDIPESGAYIDLNGVCDADNGTYNAKQAPRDFVVGVDS